MTMPCFKHATDHRADVIRRDAGSSSRTAITFAPLFLLNRPITVPELSAHSSCESFRVYTRRMRKCVVSYVVTTIFCT